MIGGSPGRNYHEVAFTGLRPSFHALRAGVIVRRSPAFLPISPSPSPNPNPRAAASPPPAEIDRRSSVTLSRRRATLTDGSYREYRGVGGIGGGGGGHRDSENERQEQFDSGSFRGGALICRSPVFARRIGQSPRRENFNYNSRATANRATNERQQRGRRYRYYTPISCAFASLSANGWQIKGRERAGALCAALADK